LADGGYDAGYSATECFWGTEAASLVKAFLTERDVDGFAVLDVGCGEGKNANAFAKAGASVIAIDCSDLAVANGQRLFESKLIDWRVADASSLILPADSFDVVVSYGLFHCLSDKASAERLISDVQRATKPGGYNIFCTFNDRSQDLSAHPGFEPLLLGHEWYLGNYAGWLIEQSSDKDLHETHPHNMIPHHHSLTRVIAKKHVRDLSA